MMEMFNGFLYRQEFAPDIDFRKNKQTKKTYPDEYLLE